MLRTGGPLILCVDQNLDVPQEHVLIDAEIREVFLPGVEGLDVANLDMLQDGLAFDRVSGESR